VIGRGGMGEVWQAAHRADGLTVAVKVLTGQGAHQEEFIRLFRNEIRAVAALDHPGIVRVLDMGAVDVAAEVNSTGRLRAGNPYLVMEFAERGSLDRYVPNMSWPIIRHVLLKVLAALAHAHARGVVHRDLKPQNLLVGCEDDGPLGLKIADFGLAHPMDLAGRTGQFEQGWGTPHYMSPEQFRGLFRDYGPSTDLYALGVVGWELSTGGLPFDGDSAIELSALHLHQELPAYRPKIEVPQGFEGWLRRLLQKDIRQRFPSAAHAAYSLRVILGEDPALAREDFAEPMGDDSGAPAHSQSLGKTHMLRASGDGENIETRHGVADTTQLFDLVVPSDDAPDAPSDGGMSTVLFDTDDFARSVAQRESAGEALAEIVAPLAPADWRQGGRVTPAPQLLGAGLGLFGLRTVRMVDRQAERDALWATLRQVHRDHQPRLVILRGRTGTGKTRIARWLCERASEVGAAKIATATHSQMDSASDGLVALFARLYGCVGLNRKETQRRLKRLLQADGVTEPYEWRALTEYISPYQKDAPDAEPSIERVRLTSVAQRFSLLRRAIERVARAQPLIICLEDVHWGAESLAWAKFLLGADPVRGPILIVASAHEDILNETPVERELLDGLAQLACAETHQIAPLGAQDTAELVQRLLLLEGGLAQQVEERSGGNPLFAVQLVGDWVSTGKLKVGERGFRLESGSDAMIPDGVHQIWRARLKFVLDRSANPADTRRALELAAALGISVQRAEWRHACNAAGLTLEDTLEETLFKYALASPGREDAPAHQSGNLLSTEWRFAHRMLRESLERLSLEAGRWEGLNSLCAETLDALYPDSPAHAQRRAHYLRQAKRLPEAATSLMMAARYRSQRSELARAHELLDELDELLDTVESATSPVAISGAWLRTKRTRGWRHRSEIFGRAGQFSKALKFGKLAAESAHDSGNDRLIAPAFCALGDAQLSLGDYRLARASYARARQAERAALAELPTFQIGLSTLGLARVAQAHGEFEEAQKLLLEARDLFEKYDETQSLARCYNALGDVARKSHQLDQARVFAEQARALFDAGGNQVGVADCLNDLAELHHLLGEPQEAESYAAQALSLYESIGSKRAMGVRLNLAFLWIDRGDFEPARKLLVHARAHFEREQQRAELAHTNMLLMACAANESDWRIWEELYREAARLRSDTGLCDPHLARAARLAADIAANAGEPTRAAQAKSLSEAFGGV